jgi:adenine-specific DNA methylase
MEAGHVVASASKTIKADAGNQHNYRDGADDDEDGKKLEQDDDDDDEAPAVDEDGEELTEAELERRRRLEYEEDDAPVVETKVQYAQVRLPKIPMASQTQKVSLYRSVKVLHLADCSYYRAFGPLAPQTASSRKSEPKCMQTLNIIFHPY